MNFPIFPHMFFSFLRTPNPPAPRFRAVPGAGQESRQASWSQGMLALT